MIIGVGNHHRIFELPPPTWSSSMAEPRALTGAHPSDSRSIRTVRNAVEGEMTRPGLESGFNSEGGGGRPLLCRSPFLALVFCTFQCPFARSFWVGEESSVCWNDPGPDHDVMGFGFDENRGRLVRTHYCIVHGHDYNHPALRTRRKKRAIR